MLLRQTLLGGFGGIPLVAGVRWSFRGKDAGSARISEIRARLRTRPRGEQRGPAALTVLRQTLLLVATLQPPVEDGVRPCLPDSDQRVARLDDVARLRALADTKAPDAEALRAESDAILERLGVVSVPKIPLP